MAIVYNKSGTSNFPVDASNPTPEGVGRNAVSITPSDTVNLTRPVRQIYVGTAGNVAAVRLDDTVVVFKNAPSGGTIEGLFKRVNASNTTATDIVGQE